MGEILDLKNKQTIKKKKKTNNRSFGQRKQPIRSGKGSYTGEKEESFLPLPCQSMHFRILRKKVYTDGSCYSKRLDCLCPGEASNTLSCFGYLPSSKHHHLKHVR